jgi:lipopolysaccharide/colanic/teichoic acid biosynthesis glycosyltransferase
MLKRLREPAEKHDARLTASAISVRATGIIVDLRDVHPNTKRTYLTAKRAFDIAASALGLVCLSPLFLAVAAWIKLEDPKGAVLFKQQRMGQYGCPFTMYKFRSMYVNAAQRKQELMALNEVDGPVFKIKNDPRVTTVGKIIRKTSIDELPQLLNVLLGNMSMVGPRPLEVNEAEGCTLRQRQRELVKPGITCIWQISGRSDVSFEQWMRMDAEYINRQGIMTDFGIVLKTFPAVFMSRGAC